MTLDDSFNLPLKEINAGLFYAFVSENMASVGLSK